MTALFNIGNRRMRHRRRPGQHFSHAGATYVYVCSQRLEQVRLPWYRIALCLVGLALTLSVLAAASTGSVRALFTAHSDPATSAITVKNSSSRMASQSQTPNTTAQSTEAPLPEGEQTADEQAADAQTGQDGSADSSQAGDTPDSQADSANGGQSDDATDGHNNSDNNSASGSANGGHSSGTSGGQAGSSQDSPSGSQSDNEQIDNKQPAAGSEETASSTTPESTRGTAANTGGKPNAGEPTQGPLSAQSTVISQNNPSDYKYAVNIAQAREGPTYASGGDS